MRVLKNNTKINYKGDEYTVRSVRQIDCGVVIYDVRGPGIRQLLTSYELGEITDPKITFEAKECYYYGFEDGVLRERIAYAATSLNGRVLVYCPNVRRVMEEDEMDYVVGKNFDVVLSEKNFDRAKYLLTMAMEDRIINA